MSKVAPEAHAAVAIVADTLRVLRTRDGINLPEALLDERARNVVTALEGAFELVPHRITKVVDGLHEATIEFRAAAEDVRELLAEARR